GREEVGVRRIRRRTEARRRQRLDGVGEVTRRVGDDGSSEHEGRRRIDGERHGGVEEARAAGYGAARTGVRDAGPAHAAHPGRGGIRHLHRRGIARAEIPNHDRVGRRRARHEGGDGVGLRDDNLGERGGGRRGGGRGGGRGRRRRCRGGLNRRGGGLGRRGRALGGGRTRCSGRRGRGRRRRGARRGRRSGGGGRPRNGGPVGDDGSGPLPSILNRGVGDV